jgi:hypothetical protein
MIRMSEHDYIIKLLESMDKKLNTIQRKLNKKKAKKSVKSKQKIR